MTDIVDVKKKVREVLLADSGISAIVGTRISIGWIERPLNQTLNVPCITIVDPSENGEVGMLGGAQDEYNSIIQVDVWCKGSSQSGALNRDELAKAVKVALGKKANFAAMQAAGFILGSPSVVALDEPEDGVEPPFHRKMLRFPVMYYSDSYA